MSGETCSRCGHPEDGHLGVHRGDRTTPIDYFCCPDDPDELCPCGWDKYFPDAFSAAAPSQEATTGQPSS